MFKRCVFSAALVALAVSYLGCANYCQFQAPDVMEKGDGSFGFGFSFTKYEFEFDDTTTTTFNIPAVNFWYRYGITERLEGHAKLWLPLGASLGAKYQLIGSPQETGFGLSLGLDVGYLEIKSGDLSNKLLDFYVPVYLGIDASEAFSVYLTPQYILRLGLGDASGTNNIAGGTLGFKLGKKVNLLVEGTFAYDLTLGSPIMNGGIGFAF